jgi:hypothetical protein
MWRRRQGKAHAAVEVIDRRRARHLREHPWPAFEPRLWETFSKASHLGALIARYQVTCGV